MRESGFARQSVAFSPPVEVWELLATLQPEVYTKCLTEPWKWVLVCDKAVYGLKDAPLLWFLRCIASFKELGMLPCSHDACVWKMTRGEKLVLLLSLHVDDTLVTGEESDIHFLHVELQKRFGPMKAERGDFKHFGVHVSKLANHHIVMSQAKYLEVLKPVITIHPRGSGRQLDSEASAEEISDYRSLVSGIAWVGVTNPNAQAAASLFQGFLPLPCIRQVERLNAFLAQLKACYVPTTFTCIDLASAKLLTIADSSLGNNDKYSQAGHVVLLAHDTPDQPHLCGYVNLLNFRSGKSKRVASSSMAAEVLQLATAVEDSMFIQSWLYELLHPTLCSLDLLKIDPRQFIPCAGCTDCSDAY